MINTRATRRAVSLATLGFDSTHPLRGGVTHTCLVRKRQTSTSHVSVCGEGRACRLECVGRLPSVTRSSISPLLDPARPQYLRSSAMAYARPSCLVSSTSARNTPSRYGQRQPFCFKGVVVVAGSACPCLQVEPWYPSALNRDRKVSSHQHRTARPLVPKQCWCSTSLPAGTTFDHDKCNRLCSGDLTKICGKPQRRGSFSPIRTI